ncbi:MAG TPA: tetratricopeptide repeat protein [Terriglobales bacterium]
MKARIWAVAAGVILLMGMLTPMFAEVATVLGTCKDANGQPLVGATVELSNTDNGQKINLKTNKKGEYFSLGVPIGTYNYRLLVNGNEVFHLNKVQVNTSQSQETRTDIDLKKEAEGAAKGEGLTPEQQKALAEAKAKQEKETGTVKDLNGKLAIAVPAIKSGDFDTAITELTEATQMDATRDVVWANLGLAYEGSAGKQTDKDEKTKRYDEAATDFQKAIDLKTKSMKPNDEGAKQEVGSYYNHMAESYAKNNKVDEAMKTYDQAVQVDPSQAARYYYNEGAVLTNTGKVDEAVLAFDKAIAAAPNDPNHADAYYQKGVDLLNKATLDKNNKLVAPDGTTEAFNKYLELQPNGPNADNAKQMLAQLGATIENNYGTKKKGAINLNKKSQ